MDFSNIDQSIPLSLPLLDEWIDNQKKIESEPLKGCTLLLIQHQRGNHYPQAEALIRLGVDPKNLLWIDIPYSSNTEVRQEMIKRLHIPEKNFYNHSYRILDPYPPYQNKRVREMFTKLFSKSPERLVVLDDGAYFIEAASHFDEQLPAVAIVEQTTRGVFKIEESIPLKQFANQFPIIDVARSVPKKTLEPPFIGYAVSESLLAHLKRLPSLLEKLHQLQCLVLGFGDIGKKVAKYLSENIGIKLDHIHVCDINTGRQQIAYDQGFSAWDRSDIRKKYDLVIGCSGHQSFMLDDHIYLKDGAILASASSGTVELSRQDFIQLAEFSEVDDISINRNELDESNVHSDLTINLVDRSVKFVNGGFPVNFTGRINDIPSRYIQPTPTMMVAATVQAVKALNEDRKGFIDLDQKICEWVIGAFKRVLDKEIYLLS